MRTSTVRKRNSFPLLGSALILWWCIQHGDVIAKSHLVLPDPIKSEYDGSNTDVWLCGPERTTRWMSQKSQKTQFCSELGILWPLSKEGRKKPPTISFMSVEYHTYFLLAKGWISWHYEAGNKAYILTCLGIFWEMTSFLLQCFTPYLCLEFTGFVFKGD